VLRRVLRPHGPTGHPGDRPRAIAWNQQVAVGCENCAQALRGTRPLVGDAPGRPSWDWAEEPHHPEGVGSARSPLAECAAGASAPDKQSVLVSGLTTGQRLRRSKTWSKT